MLMSMHHVARSGFGKGTNELYDRARPSYPAPALAAIRAAINPSPLLNVLEVGSGTGIFTRAFLAHDDCSSMIRELCAIEPSEGMRAQFSQTINDPKVSVKGGTFEETHVADSWADLIVVAQAFHWCPNYDKSMAEFARTLNFKGCAVFIWNMEDDATFWVHQVRQVIQAFELGTPQYRLGLWRQTFQTESYLKFFEPPEERTFTHTLMTTLPGVIERASSKSYIAIRSEAERAQIAKDITNILEKADKAWIDEKAGTFEYPYTTTVVVMRKK